MLSRSQSELCFRICTRYVFICVDEPVYGLARGATDHLTGDRHRRTLSHQYLVENYAELLADPDRSRYFARIHRINLRRFSWWYSFVHRQMGKILSV